MIQCTTKVLAESEQEINDILLLHFAVMDSHQQSMHTVHLGSLAMEMRTHCPTVNKLELSVEQMMLIMLLLWSVVAVDLVS